MVALGPAWMTCAFSACAWLACASMSCTSSRSTPSAQVAAESEPDPNHHIAHRFWITDAGAVVERDAHGNFRDRQGQLVLEKEDVRLEVSGDEEGMLVTPSDGPQLVFAFALLLPQLHEPEQPLPLVVHLHHGWSRFRGTDNDLYSLEVEPLFSGPRSLTHSAQSKRTPALVLIPQLPSVEKVDGITHEWAAFTRIDEQTGSVDLASQPSHAASWVFAILSELLEERLFVAGSVARVDPTRLYLTGHSMGSLGAWDWLVRAPGLWAGAVTMAGYGDHRRAQQAADLPIWAFHHVDDAYNPFNGMRKMHQLVTAAQREPRMRLTALDFDTGGQGDQAHFQTPEAVWNERDDVLPWLFSQVNEEPVLTFGRMAAERRLK